MKRFLPYIIICFVIIGIAKLMSFLNQDSISSEESLISVEEIESQDSIKTEDVIPKKVDLVDKKGNVFGTVFNIDTSDIQKINTCNKLYELNFSPEEVQVLQNLRIRHDSVKVLEKDLELKKELLRSIQQDIDNKIIKLEKINTQIEEKNGSDGATQSYAKLVKIYEGMKPKDAAKIFNELQIPIMINVAHQMQDNKLAAIVSEMTPTKARDLTIALVNINNNYFSND